MFETLGYPCEHGLAAARENGTPIESLVDVFYSTDYWRKAYSGIVMPVPDVGEIDVSIELINSELLRPQASQGADRPKKRRIPSVGETVRYKKPRNGRYRCGRCFETCHNRATCNFGIP
ncbi:hypothetical protein V5N11_017201 [Cardamine amara subsp. amara]|uniref:Zinc finger PMZ-type domain-containing protein n=1 Tax=Cardamine amara subsp. amara TaxID=228776 RepID=A0ABD1BLJ2_CARAN